MLGYAARHVAWAGSGAHVELVRATLVDPDDLAYGRAKVDSADNRALPGADLTMARRDQPLAPVERRAAVLPPCGGLERDSPRPDSGEGRVAPDNAWRAGPVGDTGRGLPGDPRPASRGPPRGEWTSAGAPPRPVVPPPGARPPARRRR